MKGFWGLAAASMGILIAAAPLPGHAVPIQTDVANIINGSGFFFLGHTPAATDLQFNAIAESFPLSSTMGTDQAGGLLETALSGSAQVSSTPLEDSAASLPAPTGEFIEDGGAEVSVTEPSTLMLLGLGLLGLAWTRRLSA